MRTNENRLFNNIEGVQRIEYACGCGKGYYRFRKDIERIEKHGQLPHTCTACQKLVYFVMPYPALSYKGRVFVDFDTIRGEV
ncbi:hypothetical protein F0251_22100 [Vibrio sp. 070316B]|nr:hypothetical protein [Vibrio sp. 070316B]QFT13591.1 hypothetical protein FIV04_26910 [Vibrio sp. THAF190c]